MKGFGYLTDWCLGVLEKIGEDFDSCFVSKHIKTPGAVTKFSAAGFVHNLSPNHLQEGTSLPC